MQNKKIILIAGIGVLFLGAAAFTAGAWLNRRMAPGIAFEDLRSILIPAPELPATPPQVAGPFIERRDRTLILESKSLGADGLGAASSMSTKNQSGHLVEVMVTGATIIYRETTQPSEPFSVENQTIQQTVEEATLNELDAQSSVMVWGHRSGDRIIAEVMIYSHRAEIKRAIFEDCEICP
jgi:hypothetical protein